MKNLTDHELDLLEDHFESHRFSNSFDLVYEDQIPVTGLVLLEGEAMLTRKKRNLERIGPGTILGVHQLMNNEPVKQGCKICENARVILLQKSEILEIMKERDSFLKKIIIP